MPSVEEYLEHVDELTQRVVNAWGLNIEAGNAALLTEEFKALLEKAFRSRDAKAIADNHRQFNMLSEEEADEEKATRQAFAESYKAFLEKHSKAEGLISVNARAPDSK